MKKCRRRLTKPCSGVRMDQNEVTNRVLKSSNADRFFSSIFTKKPLFGTFPRKKALYQAWPPLYLIFDRVNPPYELPKIICGNQGTHTNTHGGSGVLRSGPRGPPHAKPLSPLFWTGRKSSCLFRIVLSPEIGCWRCGKCVRALWRRRKLSRRSLETPESACA